MDEMTENEIYEGMGIAPPVRDPAETPDPPPAGDPADVPPSSDPADISTRPEPSGDPERAPEPEEGGEGGGDVPNSDTTPGAEPSPVQQPPIPQPTQTPAQTQPMGQPATPPQTLPGVIQLAPPQVRGQIDPYTGLTVQTMADYEAYQRAYAADQERIQREQRQDALGKVGLDEEIFNAMIRDAVAADPTVQEARAAAERARAQEEAARRQAAADWYGKQIQEINVLDPGASIQGVEDLSQRDPAAFRRMLMAVGAGMSLVEAYRSVHYDRLLQSQVQAAEQRARNQAAGKSHMVPLGGKTGSGDDVVVPAEVAQTFRELIPGISDKEIREQYAATLKETAAPAGS